MSRTYVEPTIIEKGLIAGRWMVVIYNNSYNTMDEVVEVLMKATGCSLDKAYMNAWEAHTFGQAPAHFADRDECEIVAAMISLIGVRTEVRPEWEE